MRPLTMTDAMLTRQVRCGVLVARGQGDLHCPTAKVYVASRESSRVTAGIPISFPAVLLRAAVPGVSALAAQDPSRRQPSHDESRPLLEMTSINPSSVTE